MLSSSVPCLVPSSHSPSSLLLNLKSTKTLKDLRQLHSLAIKTGQIHNPLTAAEALRISALSNPPDLQYARKLFDQMPEPNLFSYNTLIRAFSESDDNPLEALQIFLQLLHYEPLQPNRYTFPSILKACARIKGYEHGRQIHCLIVKLGIAHDGFVFTNLVRMYSVCGLMDDAQSLVRKSSFLSGNEAGIVLNNILIDGYFRLRMIREAREVFETMSNRTVVSWNGMISNLVEIGLFKEAIDIFHRMQVEGMKPNYVTLVSVLPAISRIGALELGKWVHLYAERSGIVVDDILGSALVDMYSKCGNIEKAIQVFEGLPKGSPITWNALISGLAMHGQARQALKYFKAMEQASVSPSDVTFIGILNACSHAGFVCEGRNYFDIMVKGYGLRPRLEHYGCLVDMLGRAGRIEEAVEIVKKMPVKPDDVIYKALLSACMLHENSELGAWAANKLVELAPYDSGCYVLLSNLYASMGDWEAVANVRLKMKELDIRKDPGCSWITVDGIVHEFVVEDDTHPRATEIKSMLEEMADKLRSEGYVPDTRGVLVNIDEEEKESAVLHHSEKIALSFGLISTNPGVSLQIVKNLRICADCHESIKLASKIYGRRIIVRDRIRFHHFEDGFCSCNNYW
ncbi:uncharacterized protein A4U43_C08F26590 [Asparagus officinalis]|uniref:pentatricopeptide repeat-containing protein At5g48910-like n=1 Tax=Asparagus officinalis TaxID=4686 RepID=UPI00098E73F1|nr:pentatricopeptide repeat-containing protein At5g48910-like [Asparagus officinalis]ONK61134.1 uncharacterized protein A4U43_C08F26590 [Asparagus officinalis]